MMLKKPSKNRSTGRYQTIDVEKAIKKQVYWKIPNNYYTMMSSINKGIPVSEVNENSNITESFTQLASKITEDMFEQDLKG